MKIDIEMLKELPRKSSQDYLALMHRALETNDKKWFEELAKEKTQLEQQEKAMRVELGYIGE